MQFIPGLKAAGWRVSHRPNRPSRPWSSSLRNRMLRQWHHRCGTWRRRRHRAKDVRDAAEFDVVFVNRDLLAGEVIWEQRLLQQNPRVIFDFDDTIFLGDKKRAHIEWICRNAAWVTAGNDYLADFARRLTDKVTVLPTVVDTDGYKVKDHTVTQPAGIRIGWLGSPFSIAETLFPHLEMLAALQKQIGFEVVIISKPRPELPATTLKWNFIPWSPETESEIAQHFDIGVMPLVDDEFQRGKCGLKLLQYMAAGLPVISSPVGINRTIAPHGGYVAAGAAEWRAAISALENDANLRRDLGLRGRKFCEQHYSLSAWLPELLSLLEKISGNKASALR